MILLALLELTLACPAVRMVNKTKEPWTEHDNKTLAYVQTQCKKRYPNSPCVKMFRKFGYQSYTVLCGKADNTNALDLYRRDLSNLQSR